MISQKPWAIIKLAWRLAEPVRTAVVSDLIANKRNDKCTTTPQKPRPTTDQEPRRNVDLRHELLALVNAFNELTNSATRCARERRLAGAKKLAIDPVA
jgi:hypothetical protein